MREFALPAPAAMRLGELEHAYLACAIYLCLAFTLSATWSGIDRILAQCSLLHQCGAQEVGRAQDDSLPSSDRVLFFMFSFVFFPGGARTASKA